MIRRPPRSTLSSSSAASDVYKRQKVENVNSDDFYYYMLQENGEPIKVLLPNEVYPRVMELIAGLHNAHRQIANIKPPQSLWVYFRFLVITKRMSIKIMGTARHIVGVKFSPAWR